MPFDPFTSLRKIAPVLTTKDRHAFAAKQVAHCIKDQLDDLALCCGLVDTSVIETVCHRTISTWEEQHPNETH